MTIHGTAYFSRLPNAFEERRQRPVSYKEALLSDVALATVRRRPSATRFKRSRLTGAVKLDAAVSAVAGATGRCSGRNRTTSASGTRITAS